ncbi:MAG: dockerin type I repeat-containing protein, partial [Clostridia bacterium]|nr:dockerin type I repeat-containing protein [Clostridia bacterium]
MQKLKVFGVLLLAALLLVGSVTVANAGPWVEPTAAYGDINEDGLFDISDILALRDHIFGDKTLFRGQFQLADVNGDWRVDVLDLIQIRDLIFGGKPNRPDPADWAGDWKLLYVEDFKRPFNEPEEWIEDTYEDQDCPYWGENGLVFYSKARRLNGEYGP